MCLRLRLGRLLGSVIVIGAVAARIVIGTTIAAVISRATAVVAHVVQAGITREHDGAGTHAAGRERGDEEHC